MPSRMLSFPRRDGEEQSERYAYQQDGILFQITATQQRKLDQPFQSTSHPFIGECALAIPHAIQFDFSSKPR
jgi:hypothetical protein